MSAAYLKNLSSQFNSLTTHLQKIMSNSRLVQNYVSINQLMDMWEGTVVIISACKSTIKLYVLPLVDGTKLIKSDRTDKGQHMITWRRGGFGVVQDVCREGRGGERDVWITTFVLRASSFHTQVG